MVTYMNPIWCSVGNAAPGRCGTPPASCQTNEQRDKGRDRNRRVGIISKRFQGTANNNEYQCKTCQQDCQGDFVRSFLARSAFHQGDHLIQETFTRFGRHFHLDLVGQYFRTACYRTLVSTRFTDHRSIKCRYCRARSLSHQLPGPVQGTFCICYHHFRRLVLPGLLITVFPIWAMAIISAAFFRTSRSLILATSTASK